MPSEVFDAVRHLFGFVDLPDEDEPVDDFTEPAWDSPEAWSRRES
jgi:hypothetical protein